MINIICTKQWTFLILEGGQFDSHKFPLLKQPKNLKVFLRLATVITNAKVDEPTNKMIKVPPQLLTLARKQKDTSSRTKCVHLSAFSVASVFFQ